MRSSRNNFERRALQVGVVNADDQGGREVRGLWEACTCLGCARSCMSRAPSAATGVKLAAGKAPKRPLLPEVQSGDQTTSSKGATYKSPRTGLLYHELPGRPELPRLSPAPHRLVRGAKTALNPDIPLARESTLSPTKTFLVDITASKTGLDKALAFASDLFNALKQLAIAVLIQSENLRRVEVEEREQPRKRQIAITGATYRFKRPTVVYIGTIAIGLSVVEMSEDVLMRYVSNGKYMRDAHYVPPKSRRYIDHSWTTTREMPAGASG